MRRNLNGAVPHYRDISSGEVQTYKCARNMSGSSHGGNPIFASMIYVFDEK